MPRKRIKGGEKNENSGKIWCEGELQRVLELYFELNGKGIHEMNPSIISLGKELNRTTRSVEAQLIMFRSIQYGGKYGHVNANKLCQKVWDSYIKVNSIDNLPKRKSYNNMNDLRVFFNWFGHSGGGVKIAFTEKGTPTEKIIKTDLIFALDSWLAEIKSKTRKYFSKIFLLGGPGNGKTEALDYAVKELIKELNVDNELYKELSVQAYSAERTITLDIDNCNSRYKSIVLVQDASKGYDSNNNPASSMLHDFSLITNEDVIYICCINRGILQDVLEEAKLRGLHAEFEFFDSISKCMDFTADFIENTWPLQIKLNGKTSEIGVWPMESSSLFDSKEAPGGNNNESPFTQALDIALNNPAWQTTLSFYKEGAINYEFCPLIANHNSLKITKGRNVESLIKDFETSTNRRLTFREMLSLIVFLLVGQDVDFMDENTPRQSPQEYISNQIKKLQANADNELGYEILFKLSMYQWEFRLFNCWPEISEIIDDRSWKSLLFSNVNSNKFPAIKAFGRIFSQKVRPFNTDHEKVVNNLSLDLDPAKIYENYDYSSNFNPGKIDIYLQDSVGYLYSKFEHSDTLSKLDIEVLKFFSVVESELDDIRIMNDNNSINSIIERLNFILRKSTSTYLKRKLGALSGISSESQVIVEYCNYNSEAEINDVIQKLLDIKNPRVLDNVQIGDISIGLNTTFGQPDFESSDILLEKLISYSIQVYQPSVNGCIQPIPNSKYLKLSIINNGQVAKSFIIPFSFQLFKAVKDIGKGLKKGTLPRDIVATFDRMKSFLEGIAVHSLGDDNIRFPNSVRIKLSHNLIKL